MNCGCCRKHAAQTFILSAVVLECLAGMLSPLRAAIPQTGCYKRAGIEPKIEAVIEESRASVPGLMEKGDVPGAAIALVDDKEIVWTEGFGHGGGKKKPVTPDTPFMICGMSKLIKVSPNRSSFAW